MRLNCMPGVNKQRRWSIAWTGRAALDPRAGLHAHKPNTHTEQNVSFLSLLRAACASLLGTAVAHAHHGAQRAEKAESAHGCSLRELGAHGPAQELQMRNGCDVRWEKWRPWRCDAGAVRR